MSNRGTRLRLITELLRRHTFRSQMQLIEHLRKHGFDVTQATVSRDLRSLGAVKTPQGYSLPTDMPVPTRAGDALELVTGVDRVRFTVVVHTHVGHAQPVGVYIDSLGLSEVVGCIAGDNTVMVVCRNEKAATHFMKQLVPAKD